jgi:hypothetical protein
MSQLLYGAYECEGCGVKSAFKYQKPSFVGSVRAFHKCDTCGSTSTLAVKRIVGEKSVGIALVRFDVGAGATKRTKGVRMTKETKL